MSLLEAVILGIVQGFTEFLPVSSSGHLAIFSRALGKLFGVQMATEQDNVLFYVVLHLGTLLPVFIVLRKEIWGILKKPFQKLTGIIIVGTIPAVIVALLWGDAIEGLYTNILFLAIAFVLTGLLLLYADCVKPKHLTKDLKDITYVDAVVVGVVQAVAITPAISRSGSTTAGSLFRKLNRDAAARFVFLLSIPAILGAAVLKGVGIIKDGITFSNAELLNLAFGFAAAALSGYLAVSLAFKLIKKARLRYFSFYLFALAAFILVDIFLLSGAVFG